MTNTLLAELEPGSQIDGFTIEKKIGEGGMALLHLAHDATGRARVLKVPRRALNVDPVAVVAFENELRLAHYLEDFPHAHMPVAQSGGEQQYLVMDYIEGTDLYSHLREHGCLSEQEAVTLTKKIVHALAELHRRRIIHLDVKLSNIMIMQDGDIRLIDFGLAHHLDFPDHIYECFQDPKGTPAYIAPEQFFGVRDEPRSDIFSIGTMLYEMTTSKLPFPDAHSALDVVNRIKRAPRSPREYNAALSSAFSDLVLTCLQNIPERRFADMDALHAALEQLEAVVVPPPALSAPQPATYLRQRAAADPSSIFARLTGEVLRVLRPSKDNHLDEIQAWIAEHVRRRPPAPFRIIAALDSKPGKQGDKFNLEILAQAIRQAQLQSSIITVVTVLRGSDIRLAADERERMEINADYQEVRGRMLRTIGSVDAGNLSISVHIRGGDPVDAIAGCVKDYEADLLVIGARDRNALSRLVLGSTAYKVLTTIKCPIFVIQETIAKRARQRKQETRHQLVPEAKSK